MTLDPRIAPHARSAAYGASARAPTIHAIAEALGFVVVQERAGYGVPAWEAMAIAGEPTRIHLPQPPGRARDRSLAEAMGHLLAAERLGAVPEDSRGCWARHFSNTLLEAMPGRIGRPPRRCLEIHARGEDNAA
jgi:hypothetical protein